jgi:dienelactone hydrolase
MRRIIAILLVALISSAVFARAQSSAPFVSPAICGKGTFLFMLGDNPAGRETFEIKCLPGGGYSAAGHTEMKAPGVALDLNTTLEADKAGLPVSSTAKGTANSMPFEQSVTIKDATAVVTTRAGTREVPFSKGTVLLGGNIFYMFQFALAPYDVARGGVQEIPVFPNITMRVERAGRDEIQPALAAGGKVSFERYAVTVGLSGMTTWVDAMGRLSVIAVPAQGFYAVREEYKDYLAGIKASIASRTASAPDYSAPAGAPFTAEEVSVPAKGLQLAGTLLLPKSGKRPLPAVITITGSGQQDRDERLPLPGLEGYKPFRQIAETLAANGIAVLRVDDRGAGKSGGRETLERASSYDFADDLRAQVEYLRKRPEIDPGRIALVGHSEGGIIAPLVAASDPRIAAIVLMAGTAKPGTLVLADQLRDLLERDPTVSPELREQRLREQQEIFKKALEESDESKVPEAVRGLWMRKFLDYDPLTTIRKVKQPVLILQGALDRQVTAEQAAMLEKALAESGNKDVAVHVLPGLNHLFLPSKTGAFTEYSTLGTDQLGEDLLKILSDWLQRKLKASK